MAVLTLKQIEQLLDKKLKNFATKDDVQAIVSNQLKGYATKDDLVKQTEHFDKKLDEQTKHLEQTMGDLGGEILEAVDRVGASKDEMSDLDKRVTKIQKTLQSV